MTPDPTKPITLRCGDCGTVFDIEDTGERPLYHTCPGCGTAGILRDPPTPADPSGTADPTLTPAGGLPHHDPEPEDPDMPTTEPMNKTLLVLAIVFGCAFVVAGTVAAVEYGQWQSANASLATRTSDLDHREHVVGDADAYNKTTRDGADLYATTVRNSADAYNLSAHQSAAEALQAATDRDTAADAKLAEANATNTSAQATLAAAAVEHKLAADNATNANQAAAWICSHTTGCTTWNATANNTAGNQCGTAVCIGKMVFGHNVFNTTAGWNGLWEFQNHPDGVAKLEAKSMHGGFMRIFWSASEYQLALDQHLNLADPNVRGGWIVDGNLHYPQDASGHLVTVPAGFGIWSSQADQLDLTPHDS